MTSALTDAYDTCLRLVQSHYENFPVASRLLPANLRPHIAAIYAFARVADDFADEPGRTPEERLRLLEDWERQLLRLPEGQVLDANPVFLALHDTIERFDLPFELFSDLLSAFTQDVTTTRYASWSELLDYCRRSANPVGRLVLRVFGYRRADLDVASDAFCTALQLTNFWQDLGIDWSRGRLYVPKGIYRQYNADSRLLSRYVLDDAWQSALRDCSGRARQLFDKGRPVCDGVTGRLRYELRATWLGGTRMLDRLEQGGFDVFSQRPKLGARDALVIAWGTAVWRQRPGKKQETDSR